MLQSQHTHSNSSLATDSTQTEPGDLINVGFPWWIQFPQETLCGWPHPPFPAKPSVPNPVHTGPAVKWSQLKHPNSPGTSGNSATGSASKKQLYKKRCLQCLKAKHSFYKWNFSQRHSKQSETLRKMVSDQLWWLDEGDDYFSKILTIQELWGRGKLKWERLNFRLNPFFEGV